MFYEHSRIICSSFRFKNNDHASIGFVKVQHLQFKCDFIIPVKLLLVMMSTSVHLRFSAVFILFLTHLLNAPFRSFLPKQTTPIIYQHNLFQELYLLAKAVTAQDVLHGLGITMFGSWMFLSIMGLVDLECRSYSRKNRYLLPSSRTKEVCFFSVTLSCSPR